MLRKIKKLYFPLFYSLILFNLLTSIVPIGLFWKFGFKNSSVYLLAAIIKLTGYILSVLAEKLLNQKRKLFFQNLGFSYRHIFAYLFFMDFLYLFIVLIICRIIQAYI